MRKFLLTFIIGILLVGCTDDTSYQNALEKGLDYIASEEYQKSESAFEIALEEKPDDERAMIYLQQVVAFQDLIAAFDTGNFDQVQEFADEVVEITDGSNALVKRTEEYLEQIDELQSVLNELKEEYEMGLSELEDGNFEEATKQVELILEKDLDHPIYLSLLDDTKQLEEDIKKSEEKAKEEERIQAEEQTQAEKAKQESEGSESSEQVRRRQSERVEAQAKKDAQTKGGLSDGEMRQIAKDFVDAWTGNDNPFVEEEWLDNGVEKFFVFRDGDADRILALIVNSETGEITRDMGMFTTEEVVF